MMYKHASLEVCANAAGSMKHNIVSQSNQVVPCACQKMLFRHEEGVNFELCYEIQKELLVGLAYCQYKCLTIWKLFDESLTSFVIVYHLMLDPVHASTVKIINNRHK